MAESLSFRQINKLVNKLHLSDNSLVLVKSGTPIANHATILGLAEAVERMPSKPTVVFLVVDDIFGDLRLLDEGEMAELGWFRSETLRNLIVRAKEINANMETKDEPENPPVA